MLVGNRAIFAMEWEIKSNREDWIFGHLRFWAGNHPIGNWEDSTSINGVKNWMRDFGEEAGQRSNHDLMLIPKAQAFDTIYEAAFIRANNTPEAWQENSNLFRHSISHLGMSTFDRYDLFLIESTGQQRLIWREGDEGKLHEVYLPAGELQKVARAFCYLVGNPHR